MSSPAVLLCKTVCNQLINLAYYCGDKDTFAFVASALRCGALIAPAVPPMPLSLSEKLSEEANRKWLVGDRMVTLPMTWRHLSTWPQKVNVVNSKRSKPNISKMVRDRGWVSGYKWPPIWNGLANLFTHFYPVWTRKCSLHSGWWYCSLMFYWPTAILWTCWISTDESVDHIKRSNQISENITNGYLASSSQMPLTDCHWTKKDCIMSLIHIGLNTASSGVFRMCERRRPRGSGGRKSPSWIHGQSPGRGSGDEVPQKLTLFCYWMPEFWCFRRKN